MTEPRLLGYMVTHNEADRYLQSCLTHAMNLLDGLAVFDDASMDETPCVAREAGAVVACRPPEVPSFLWHEGRFRQAAWEHFEEKLEPQVGDWVLALDADEFLVEDEPDMLRAVIAAATSIDIKAILLQVPEVFDARIADDGTLFQPRVRVDGFWGGIAGTRLFAYYPHGAIADKAMGCGAEPTYAQVTPRREGHGLHLLHLGYAMAEDRAAKYHRYTSARDHGHADRHIRSIIEPPMLEEWTGPWPDVWRGRR